MHPKDAIPPNADPETFWKQHGDFVIIISVLLAVIVWGQYANWSAEPVAFAKPSTAIADLKEIFWGLVSILGQIAILIFVARIFWPIIRFFGMIAIGGGIFFLLHGKGFF